jgi:hypothetical protein
VCDACLRKSEQLHKRPTKRRERERGQSGRRIFPAGCIPRAHVYKKHFCLELLWKFGAVHIHSAGNSIVFSFSLGRGAKSSFCASARWWRLCACEALVLDICIHKLFINIFYLLNPTIWNSHTESVAHKWQVAFLHKFVKCGREGDCKIMQQRN